jgi:ABC-type amino acid transport substrate-binding protein
MNRHFIALLCLCCLSGSAAADVLKLGVFERPPYSRADGSGLLDQVAKSVFEQLGHEVRFVSAPGGRQLQLLAQGHLDGDVGRLRHALKLYPELIQLNQPSNHTDLRAYSLHAMPKIDDWPQLTGRRVTYLRGFKLLDHKVPASAETIKADHAEQLFELLDNGRVEVVICDALQARYLLGDARLELLQSSPLQMPNANSYITLHPSHANLRDAADAVLQRMHADGRYADLYQRITGTLPAEIADTRP